MTSLKDIVNEASYLAVKFDQVGHTHRAIQCYRISVRFLMRLRDQSGEDKAHINAKILEYQQRIEELYEIQKKKKQQLCKVALIPDKNK